MDEFSVLASQEIFESFPEWREFAREESGDDGSTFLVVEIPPLASADTVHGLWVYTCNQEITIEFDYFHSHFAVWSGDENALGEQPAVDFVHGILSDRIAIISWWDKEKFLGSTSAETGQSPELPNWLTNINRTRVRSWSGKLNSDAEA